MAKGARRYIKKQMVWEGKFTNIFKNMHFLHGGAASASRDAAPFYKQIELDTKKKYVTGSYGVMKEVSKPELQQFGSGSRPVRYTIISGSVTPSPK